MERTLLIFLRRSILIFNRNKIDLILPDQDDSKFVQSGGVFVIELNLTILMLSYFARQPTLNRHGKSEDILCRLIKCINLFRVTAPDLLFQEALKRLPTELRQIAFNWAFELVAGKDKFSTQNLYLLWDLSKKFGYQNEEAKEIINARLAHV